jgi:hypothetical protein
MRPIGSASRPAGPTHHASATRKSLTKGQQALLALLQHVRHGRVHRLAIRHGEPDLSAGVVWTWTVKVLGENGPHPCSQAEDFHLRREVVEFFKLLAAMGDGEVHNIEVRNGLPFTFEVEGTVSA